MNKKFSEIIASSVEFKAKTWEQLQSAFPNASYLQNKFITSDNVYFVLSSQFNSRLPLWEEQEFLGYFNLQVLKGLENLSFSMGLWLDTTIETTISDPSKRGATRSSVLSGVSENFVKANDFSDIATPINGESTIANQSQVTSTNNNTDTALDFITNIQNLYSAELSSKWTFFLKEFNWLFQQVFSYAPQDNTSSNVPSDIQAQIDAINEKIEEIVNFANALNTQVQANKSDINGIKQEILTDITPELTEQGKAIVLLSDLPVQNNAAGEIIKLSEVTAANPILTKAAGGGGTPFTPTQANIYPTIVPMLIAGSNTTITKDDTKNTLTFTASGGTSGEDDLLRAKPVLDSQQQTTLLANTEPILTKPAADILFSNFKPSQANMFPGISPMIIAGTNVTVTPNITNNTIAIASTGGSSDLLFSTGENNTSNIKRSLSSPGVGGLKPGTIDIVLEDEQAGAEESSASMILTSNDANGDIAQIQMEASADNSSISGTFKTQALWVLSGTTIESGEVKIDQTNLTYKGTVKALSDIVAPNGGGFTPTQANIYPTIKPMLVAGSNITLTPNDTGTNITIASTGAPTDIKFFEPTANWQDIYDWAAPNNIGKLFWATPNGTSPYALGIVLSQNGASVDYSFMWDGKYMSATQATRADGAVKGPIIPMTYSFTDLKGQLIAGNNITLTPNDASGNIKIDAATFTPSLANLFPIMRNLLLAGTNTTISPNETNNTLTLNANVSQSLLYPFLKTMLVGSNGLIVTPTDATSTITLDTSALASSVSTNTNAITKLNAVGIAAKGNVFNLATIPSTEKLATQSYADNIPNQGRTWKTVGIGSDLTVLNDGDVVKCWIIASGNNYEVEISGFFQKTVGVNLTGFKFDTNGIAWATAFGGNSGSVGLSGPAMAVRKANGGQMTLPSASVRDNKVYCLTAVNIT